MNIQIYKETGLQEGYLSIPNTVNTFQRQSNLSKNWGTSYKYVKTFNYYSLTRSLKLFSLKKF